jgi:lipoyl-dependent peroxiredoxin
MAATRTAKAHWEGTLKEGQGEVDLISSGIGQFEVTWASRVEQPNGKTSPEELIAAAHSTCFSMSVANELVKAGNPAPASVDTTADVTFQQGGPGIIGIKIACSVVLPGADREKFEAGVAAAQKNCPVSRALAATPISYDVRLVEAAAQ